MFTPETNMKVEQEMPQAMQAPDQLMPKSTERHHYLDSVIIEIPRADFSVIVKPCTFGFLWFVMAVMHVMCACCFGAQSWVYWQLAQTSLASNLALYHVTMPVSTFPVIAFCYGAVAITHCYFLGQMLTRSLWHRAFTFGLTSTWKWQMKHSARYANIDRLASKFTHVFNSVFSDYGFLGVKGHYFPIIYTVREISETILQTIQAYKMSLLVPRVAVNRILVLTIVGNCWSTPIINHIFEHNPALERLLCLICDIALDFISTVGVPLVLAAPYWQQYDAEITDFPISLWINGIWLVNLIHELRMVLVSSWINLFSELIFSSSLIICLQDVKCLLQPYSNNLNQNYARVHAQKQSHQDQLSSLNNKIKIRSLNPSRPSQTDSTHSFRKSSYLNTFRVKSARFTRVLHIFMVVWGFLVVALHIQASIQRSAVHCAQQAWPWFYTRSGCMLMRLNCNETLGSNGNLSELDTALMELNEQLLSYIEIRHCSSIHIPSRIQKFSNIIGIKIYNSTIAEWDADAALATKYHPDILFLYLIQTNMTQIPLGLLSPDFPAKLLDIELSWTNLTSLPDDLSNIWPDDCFISLERGQFNSIPQTFLRESNQQISLASNNITTLPTSLFTSTATKIIWLNANPISELPDSLVPSKSIGSFDFSSTMLESLPSWANASFFQSTSMIAGGTPLCDQILKAFTSIDNNSISSNLTQALNAYQSGRLSCETSPSAFYPYSSEAQQDP